MPPELPIQEAGAQPTEPAPATIPPEAPAAPQLSDDEAILAEIDETRLSNYILDRMKNDLRDREAFGWSIMRHYDILSYKGIKAEAKDPWYKASNFPVPLTPTLLDTGHAHVMQSMWSEPNRVIRAEGVGPEDERSAKNIEHLHNWQVVNGIDDSYDTLDKTVKRSLQHGNGAIKVIHGSASGQKAKVIWSQVPIENIFMPVNARGAQPSQTDHIFELIPLSESDWELRRSMTKPDGSPLYKGIDVLPKGNTIGAFTGSDTLMTAQDSASGTSLGDLYSREMRYMMECYVTYPHKKSEEEPAQMIELIVWVSPMGGQILNKVVNPDKDEEIEEYVRPYSIKWIPYPETDRIYGDSLPWRIKHIQEELDYAHNQNMNAAEISLKPPKFYRAGSGFDPDTYELYPDGWYPVANPQTDIFIPTFNVNPIFERQEDKYWDLAERLTGLTELFQGRSPDQRQTATLTNARENKAEVRFNTLYRRFEAGFNELIQLTYFYNKKYMADDVKVKIMGYGDYKKVSEMFPKGIRGKYNFYFASKTTVQQQNEKDDIEAFVTTAAMFPLVANSEVNQWRLLDFYGKSKSIRTLDNILEKPAAAEIFSADEALRRILSGQYDVIPDPQIDAPRYLTKIQMFMMTDMYAFAEPEIKQAVELLLARVQAINFGQTQAIQDAQMLQAHMQAEAQANASAQQAGQAGNEQTAPSKAQPAPAGMQ